MELPFDLADPPREPPRRVVQPLLWRVAVCVFRDHVPALFAAHLDDPVRCATCRRAWPCRCRRLSERALLDAFVTPKRSRNPLYLDWLAHGLRESRGD